MRFNCEAVLILDLHDGIAYTACPNELLLGRFKFSLAKSKVTTLEVALRELKTSCKPHRYVLRMNLSDKTIRKRGVEDKGPQADKRPRKDEERVRHFYTTSRNILMEIKGNLMLRQPQPIKTLAKFRNKNKCCEYHKD